MTAPEFDPIEVRRHPSARRARLSVDAADGRVRLILPPRAPLRPALAWAETKRDWIERQRALLPRPVPFTDGAAFPFRGQSVTLRHNPSAPREPSVDGTTLQVGGPVDGVARRVTMWLRHQALSVLTEATRHYAGRAGVTVTDVAIGDPRRRWGSCSASGAIRYSWRLILAPPDVLDATVAHEVAHRVHMNHSPAFHALVAQILGDDPAAAMQWLRHHGATLHWIGRST